MAGIIEYAEAIDNDYLTIKFEPSLKRSSITNDKFTVYTTGATPTQVTSPFQTIDVANHYQSISKLLTLYWSADKVDPDTQYELRISGLQNALGMTLPDSTILFKTSTGFVTDPEPFVPPDDIGFVEEDYSVKTDTYTGESIGSPVLVSGGFSVQSVEPADGATYLNADENNGVVEINFSGVVSANQLTPTMFKVQRKAITRVVSRWETLSAQYDRDEEDPTIVYVRLPSTDATPVYDTPGKIYYEKGYKYRIIVSKNLEGSTP